MIKSNKKILSLTNKIDEHLNGQETVIYLKLNLEIKLSGGCRERAHPVLSQYKPIVIYNPL